jgi:succinate dehydrogenase / fumarate reductase cytochrome b subunit
MREIALRPGSDYAPYVGKKFAMAISGGGLMAFVFVHMVGKLQLYLGARHIHAYAVWLPEVGDPAYRTRSSG